jgi:uncharacterized membrane protein (UPF0127 family)
MFYANPSQPKGLWSVFSFKIPLRRQGLSLLTVIVFWAGVPMTAIWANEPLAANPKDKTVMGQTLPIGATVRIGAETLELEVAKTPRQQEIGLMNRRSLAANRGMIFLFSPPRVALFWMKNTLIPLDIIFLSNNKVVAIYSNVPPCTKDPCPTYGPLTAIDRVIELQSGRAKALGLQKGDILEVKFRGKSS